MANVLLLHGAWCWQPLIEELGRRSLEAVAPDLPREDPSAGIDDYVECALAALDAGGRPVVVGHSLAGILLERLAAVRPVSKLVYLAAFLPIPGASLREQWRAEPMTYVVGWDCGLTVEADGSSHWSDPEAARLALFGNASEDAGADAASQLGPQYWGLSRSTFAGSLRTPSMYLSPCEDRLLNGTWLRRRAAARLAGPVITMPGDHCPMLSDVDALATEIERIVADSGG